MRIGQRQHGMLVARLQTHSALPCCSVAMEVCIIAVPILWMYAIVTAITGNIAKSRLYHRLLDGGVVMTFRRRHPMRSRMLAFLVLAGAALAAVVWQWSHSASSNRDVFSNTSIVMAQAFVLCSFYVNRVLYAEDRLTTVNSWVSGRTTRSAGDALAELRSCSELDAVVAYRVLYGQAKEAVHASGKRGCCAYSAVRVDLRDVGQLAADLADGKESDDSRKAALSLRSCCWRMYGTYTIPIAMLNCSPLKDDRTLGMVLQAGQSCTYGILLMLQFLAALRSG